MMIRKYQLPVPTDLFMMIKALVTAEGTVRLINPEMDLVAELRPHLKRVATQRFSPEAVFHGVRALLLKLAAAPPVFPNASAISSRKWSGVNCESDLNTAIWAASNPPSKKEVEARHRAHSPRFAAERVQFRSKQRYK
jgi:predicted unusual protein kinase regulating ubiquinone biosynthesis (AarF/ABC1/UbiB family)